MSRLLTEEKPGATLGMADEKQPATPPDETAAQVPRIGRYELLDQIGKGGMGAVYRGRDTMLGRMVAVKMLLADLEVTDESRERFFREARSAGQLTHRNIISVFDFGEEGGRAYLVMELLQGESLTKVMAQEKPLPLEQRLDMMLQVCEGLGFAHARSIVHRDVKPANLFLTTEGQVKVLDFGVARIAQSNLTRAGLIVGTPDYMSPEQVRGEVVDQRSDIFSTGAVFYQLLAGRKPFAAKSLPMVLQLVATADPAPLTEAEAPPELAAVVKRALEKDPKQRYQHMQEMVADLTRVQQAFLQGTREFAAQAAERYRDVEHLLSESQTLAQSLGVTVEREEVAAYRYLKDLPAFREQGGDALKTVTLRRHRAVDLLTRLQQQYDAVTARNTTWRAAGEVLTRAEAMLAGGRPHEARILIDTARTLVPESGRVAVMSEQCKGAAANAAGAAASTTAEIGVDGGDSRRGWSVATIAALVIVAITLAGAAAFVLLGGIGSGAVRP